MKKLILSATLLFIVHISTSYGQTAFSYHAVDIFANEVASAVNGVIEGVFLKEDGSEYMGIALDRSTPFLHVSRGLESVDMRYRDVKQLRSWTRDNDGDITAFYMVGYAVVMISFIDTSEHGFRLLYITYNKVKD